MISFRDKCYCSWGENCATHPADCDRKWTNELQASAVFWWGGEDVPVAFCSFKDSCGKYVEVRDGNDQTDCFGLRG